MTPVANAQSTEVLKIDGNSLSLADIGRVSFDGLHVDLSDEAHSQLANSRKVVEAMLADREIVYGITTGFGKFKDVYIPPEDSLALQRKFLLSHAAGVGPSFDIPAVRAITLLRANALAKGFSGIRTRVVRLLLALLNQRVHPLIPEKGSVGASGDLAPLAHLALVLIGEGHAEVEGRLLPGREALAEAGLSPVILKAKEGLALTNGTQVMAGLGALTVIQAEKLARLADIIGAMSLEGMLGTDKAFDEAIHQVRPHPGQARSAANLRTLLAGSEIIKSHEHCAMVQDAYSLRCMPQIHGASRQAFSHAREVLEIEINSATDNPLVFTDTVISGGNFHGQPLALVLDYVAIALAELANVSERRTERLVNPSLSNGLPPFLAISGGLNSGFMIAQYTAAALVSENKCLAHPASVDSIPTSANQEDHVSMGTISARKARDILENLKNVLAIELLCAAQALDMRTGRLQPERTHVLAPAGVETTGKQTGQGVTAAYNFVREHIPPLEEDRVIQEEIQAAYRLIDSGDLLDCVERAVGPLS